MTTAEQIETVRRTLRITEYKLHKANDPNELQLLWVRGTMENESLEERFFLSNKNPRSRKERNVSLVIYAPIIYVPGPIKEIPDKRQKTAHLLNNLFKNKTTNEIPGILEKLK